MKKPWTMKAYRGFRGKAFVCLKSLGLIDTIEGVGNAELWQKLLDRFGNNPKYALSAVFPQKQRFQLVSREEKRKAARQATAKSKQISSAVFYDSDDWKRLRYQALLKHGAACQCCGATRSDGVKLHVDHIKPRSKHPELELNLDNLQILCEPCNMGKRAWDETDWREQPPGRGMVLWAD